LDAQSLIDALKGPTGSKELKKLQLDNIEVQEEDPSDDEGYRNAHGVGRLPDCWTTTCKMEHIDELEKLSQSCGYILSGTALYARELSREILAERDSVRNWRRMR
jgi:hypothetical protein